MKWYCTVCGYVHEGDQPPEQCPVCKQPASKFKLMEEEAEYATVHKLGEGKAEGVSEDIIKDLKANFEGECAEVGMYLAMARVADREGYPEIAEAFKRYAFEEADHASRFAELLGEVLTDSTEKNLKMRADAEAGACEGKFDLAKRAKAANLDAIHDTVHEMAKDEARHGAGFKGLLKRYFGLFHDTACADLRSCNRIPHGSSGTVPADSQRIQTRRDQNERHHLYGCLCARGNRPDCHLML